MKPTWKWWVTRRAASLTYLAASDAKRWRSKAVWSLKGRSCRKMPIKFQQPIKVRTIVPARQRARNLMHRRLGSARRTFLSLIHNLNTRLKNFHNFHRFDIKCCGDSLHPSRDLSFQQIGGANEIITGGYWRGQINMSNLKKTDRQNPYCWNMSFNCHIWYLIWFDTNWQFLWQLKLIFQQLEFLSVCFFVCLFVICLRRAATACNTNIF